MTTRRVLSAALPSVCAVLAAVANVARPDTTVAALRGNGLAAVGKYRSCGVGITAVTERPGKGSSKAKGPKSGEQLGSHSAAAPKHSNRNSSWAVQQLEEAERSAEEHGVATLPVDDAARCTPARNGAARSAIRKHVRSGEEKHDKLLSRLCRHPEGCTRSASYGDPASETRLFCARHREADHEDKKHVLCSMPHCRRQGSFRRADGSGKRVCAAHSAGPRVSVRTAACVVEGCSAEATHGRVLQIAAAANASSSVMQSDDCDRYASDSASASNLRFAAGGGRGGARHKSEVRNETGTLRPLPSPRRLDAKWCAAHRPADAVDTRKREHICCIKECLLRATHGEVGRPPTVCAAHRMPGYVDQRHKRCQYVANSQADTRASGVGGVRCRRQPSYGDPSDGVARFCARHRGSSHVDVRSRVCQEHGCRRVASFGEALHEDVDEGGALGRLGRLRSGVPLFCREHKAARHVNVKVLKAASHRRGGRRGDRFSRNGESEETHRNEEILFYDNFATVTLVRESLSSL
jgi:hypothetical protein